MMNCIESENTGVGVPSLPTMTRARCVTSPSRITDELEIGDVHLDAILAQIRAAASASAPYWR